MAEDKTPSKIDALVDEEVKTTGLTPEMIKEAVRSEVAKRAAKRILTKMEISGPLSW